MKFERIWTPGAAQPMSMEDFQTQQKRRVMHNTMLTKHYLLVHISYLKSVDFYTFKVRSTW